MNRKNNIFFFLFLLLKIVHIYAAVIKTISKPGVYRIRENITNSSSDPVIQIRSSDVVLDLGGYVISQGGSGEGIEIVNGYNNIVVQNGTIDGLANDGLARGIFINASQNITIENIKIRRCGSRGIECFAPTDIQILNCDIVDCCKNTSASRYGIIAQQLDRFLIRNCNIYNCGAKSGTNLVGGMLLIDLVDGRIEECNLFNNTGGAFYGIYLSANGANVTSVSCIRCRVINNGDSADPGAMYSFYLRTANTYSLHGCRFEDCLIANNYGTGMAGFLFGSAGVSIYGNLFLRCIILFNQAATSSLQAIGMNNADYFQNTIQECIVSGNHSAANFCYGITVQSADNCYISDTISSYNSSDIAIAAGFVFNTSDGHMLRNCHVVRNIGSSDANSRGIYYVSGNDVVLLKNKAFQNGALLNNQITMDLSSGATVNNLGNDNVISY